MAITVTSSSVSIKGNEYVVRGQFSLDASYPAGGYPVTGATIGLSTIRLQRNNGQITRVLRHAVRDALDHRDKRQCQLLYRPVSR